MKKLLAILVMLTAINASAQWVQMNGISNENNVISFCSIGNNIFAGTVGPSEGLYFSTNNGQTWVLHSLQGNYVGCLIYTNNIFFAGVWFDGVHKSTNNGNNWQSTPLNFAPVTSFASSGNTIYAGTSNSGIYSSTNNGTNWLKISPSNLFNDPEIIYSLYANTNVLLAGTWFNGVYRSTNNGNNWIQTNLNNKLIYSLTALDNKIFAGASDSGVYVSTNEGLNWSKTSLNNKSVYPIVSFGNNLFAGTNKGVFQSTNYGLNWINISQGLDTTKNIFAMIVYNNYIFVGTEQNSVWRRPLSEIIGIQNISIEIPTSYSLGQNYPNPFNPRTVIRFSLFRHGGRTERAVVSDVSLKVYDIQGREVQTLVKERLQAGTYQVDWDGSNFTSGVYFYRLVTEGFSETKRMMLLK